MSDMQREAPATRTWHDAARTKKDGARAAARPLWDQLKLFAEQELPLKDCKAASGLHVHIQQHFSAMFMHNAWMEELVKHWKRLSGQARAHPDTAEVTPTKHLHLAHDCAHAFAHVYAHVHTHVCRHAYTHVYTHVCAHACTHIYTHVYTHACTPVYFFLWGRECRCACACTTEPTLTRSVTQQCSS